jgi:hypothetical protein
MARRRLTPEEEQALAAQAERRSVGDAQWDFTRAKPVNRGRNPTVVLSGRVPVVYAQMLRRIATARRCSISDLVKQALESYAVAPAPQISYEGPRLMTLYGLAAPGSETMQTKTQRFISQQTSTETKATA